MTQSLRLARSIAAAVLLAGCAESRPPISAPNTMLHTVVAAGSYGVIYSFAGGADGATPMAGLLETKGTLYGTTFQGGKNGGGTVFSVTPSGHEDVLDSFGAPNDGAEPLAGLVTLKGELYGTTATGGTSGLGTIFAIATSGKERLLHSFQGGQSDGSRPYASLVNVNGTLYGTTLDGGSLNQGTVFAITPGNDVERQLYSFTGYPNGAHPQAALINAGDTLFGTTRAGAQAKELGTVFSVTTAGAEQKLHGFKGSPKDGAHPFAALTEIDGVLYGTTRDDGANGYGTVFSIDSSGSETVLYSFGGGSGDGAWPTGGLIDINGTLYGTTVQGGGSGCSYGDGCGTIYSVTTAGVEKILYRFAGGSDGSLPYAGLTYSKGVLYGTTSSGGTHGYGTVFTLSP